MMIRLRNLGEITFDNYALISSDEILVAGGDAYEKLQAKTGFQVTSINLFTNEDRWYLFADLKLPEILREIIDDEFVTRIDDQESIYRLNALL